MMSLRRRLSILLLVFASALTLSAQSGSPFEGKWVFNADKSMFNPSPLPRSETLTFANGTLTVEGVSAQGHPFLWSFTPDPGKAVLVTGRDNLKVETKEAGDTLMHTWSDQSGTSFGTGQVSKDGKSMRYILIGNRWGNHVYEVSEFYKVPEGAATSNPAPTR
jgi:hypothetical protein